MSKPNSGWYPKNHPIVKELVKEVKEKYGDDKITEEDIDGIMQTSDGKIIWLENGEHTNRGLAHICEVHLSQFEYFGISKELLPNFILDVVAYGTIIGQQGNSGTRPIYEYNYGGKTYYVAITIGNNGFIVSANPKSKVSEKEKLKK